MSQHRTRLSLPARAGAAGLLATGLVAASAVSAAAHVTVTPSVTTAGSSTVLTFGFSHGCGVSPTNQVTIQMPEELISVAPTLNSNWSIEKVMEELPEPLDDGHGGEYTERVAQVVYTADVPVEDGYRDAFELSLQLPEDSAGTTYAFPTVQTCEDGETPWIDVSDDPDAELESPAPTFTVTEAAAEGETETTDVADTTDGEAADTAETVPAAQSSDGGGMGTALGGVGLGAGLIALVLAAIALRRTARP